MNPTCPVHNSEMTYKGGNPFMDEYTCDVQGCNQYKQVEKMNPEMFAFELFQNTGVGTSEYQGAEAVEREMNRMLGKEVCVECGSVFNPNEKKYDGINSGEFLHGRCVDILVARMGV